MKHPLQSKLYMTALGVVTALVLIGHVIQWVTK